MKWQFYEQNHYFFYRGMAGGGHWINDCGLHKLPFRRANVGRETELLKSKNSEARLAFIRETSH